MQQQENHARHVREAEEQYRLAYANPNVEDIHAGMDLAVAAGSRKNSTDVLEQRKQTNESDLPAPLHFIHVYIYIFSN